MTHQEIRDRLDIAFEAIFKCENETRQIAEADREAARTIAQAECRQIGHVFSKPETLSSLLRLDDRKRCVVCYAWGGPPPEQPKLQSDFYRAFLGSEFAASIAQRRDR